MKYNFLILGLLLIFGCTSVEVFEDLPVFYLEQEDRVRYSQYYEQDTLYKGFRTVVELEGCYEVDYYVKGHHHSKLTSCQICNGRWRGSPQWYTGLDITGRLRWGTDSIDYKLILD